MPTTRRKQKGKPSTKSAHQVAREQERRALQRAMRVEKDVQRLTLKLLDAMKRTNDRIQWLADVLLARKRAIEAELDTERSIA